MSGDARVRACAPRVGASRASKPRRDDREVSRARVSSRRRSRRASIAYHGVSLRRGEAARARASPRATARASARPNPRIYGMSGTIHCVIFMLTVGDKIVSRAYVRVRTLVVSDFRYVFY